MNESLRDRIDLANQYIKFAMDRQIWGQGYFGASYPMLIEYTQPIKVTPSGNFVTVEYIDRASPEWPSNFSVHKERYNVHPGNVNSEERIGDLRYEISNYIIKAIKNGAKDEGYELPKFNPRRRKNNISRSSVYKRFRKYGWEPHKWEGPIQEPTLATFRRKSADTGEWGEELSFRKEGSVWKGYWGDYYISPHYLIPDSVSVFPSWGKAVTYITHSKDAHWLQLPRGKGGSWVTAEYLASKKRK